MNIRVDLNAPINDGTEVVFRSPVDCSQITGLIVYYQENGNTISKEFAFADAHGNNVGDIDHLFAENVVVKVILDVTTGMAFVQNADTNAYLEGRFESIENMIRSGGGVGTLVVVFDSVFWTADYSATEILRHLDKGGYVISLDGDGNLAALAGYNLDSELAIFTTPVDENGVWKEYTIDDNKTVTVKEMSFATKGQIGDIETALDAILAIQNELIGGDA